MLSIFEQLSMQVMPLDPRSEFQPESGPIEQDSSHEDDGRANCRSSNRTGKIQFSQVPVPAAKMKHAEGGGKHLGK